MLSIVRLLLVLELALMTSCGNPQQNAASAPDMVPVPAGEFLMGSDRVDREGLQQRYGLVRPLFLDEHPAHTVTLPSFFIDRYEVTNAQYKEFVRATRAREPADWIQNGYNLFKDRLEQTDLETLRWIGRDYFKFDVDTRTLDKPALLALMSKRRSELDVFPVGGVTWHEAAAFCQWQHKRLPTEAEWEKAARGPQGLEFPWGNTWDERLLNAGDDAKWEDGIAPVGSYEHSKSPYGAYDMAGNVWEWVEDWYQPYPGSTYKNPDFGQSKKVIRGGGGGMGHYAISPFFRTAARQAAEPLATSSDVGFRCARS